jgi:hypothetical protein
MALHGGAIPPDCPPISAHMGGTDGQVRLHRMSFVGGGWDLWPFSGLVQSHDHW